MVLLASQAVLSCRADSCSHSSMLLAAEQNCSRCQSWAGAAGVLPAGWAPQGPNLCIGTGQPCPGSLPVGEHQSTTLHIHRGCSKTSGSQHRQRALVLPGARSHSHGVPAPCHVRQPFQTPRQSSASLSHGALVPAGQHLAMAPGWGAKVSSWLQDLPSPRDGSWWLNPSWHRSCGQPGSQGLGVVMGGSCGHQHHGEWLSQAGSRERIPSPWPDQPWHQS